MKRLKSTGLIHPPVILALLTLLTLSTINYQLSTCFAQGTAFTYQGRLNDGGAPANGSYDVAFTLFGTNVAGATVAGPVTNVAVAVSNGLFTTTVDFGNAFTGDNRWLELAVSINGANAFTTLAPRQPVTPTPYAVFANTASNVSGTVSASQLSGSVPAANISGVMPLAQLPAGLVTNGADGVTFSGTFNGSLSGNGSGLTNLDIGNLVTPQYLIGWGDNGSGQITIPAGLGIVGAFAAGANHALAVRSNGTVVAWGNDDYGQTDVPAGLSNVVAIAAGNYHSLAVRSDGTVAAWGNNYVGQLNIPAGLNNVIAVAAGEYHSLALRSDGTVVAWGYDGSGQIDVPAGLSNVVAIAAGNYHSLAVRSDGTVAAWGDDSYGQTDVPPGLTNAIAVSGGASFSLALGRDGAVTAWGDDSSGQTDVPAGLGNVVAIAAGNYHSLALRSGGTVAAWGNDGQGQTDVPAGLTNVTAIAGGGSVSLALSGRVVSYSSAPVALLTGNNVFQGSVTAAALSGDGGGLTGLNPANLSLGTANISISGNAATANNFSGLLAGDVTGTQGATVISPDFPRLDGANFFTGPNNFFGTVTANSFSGDGSGLTNLTASQITGTIPLAQLPTSLVTNGQAGVSLSGTFAGDGGGLINLDISRLVTGRPSFTNLTAWGYDGQGQTDVPGNLGKVVGMAGGGDHTLAVRSDGTVVAWGDDDHGQTDVPAGLSNAVAVAGGDSHSLALLSDGSVAAWGWDAQGQTDVPAGLSNAVAVAAGTYHSLALRSNGTVVAWGFNAYGQLNIPAGLSNVVRISTHGHHNLTLRSDGTVSAWGLNDSGQTVVPADLTNAIAVAGGYDFSLALRSDGTVVAWGNDDHGQTDVPAGLSNAVAVAAGSYHGLALLSNGSVAAWGWDLFGDTDVPAGLNNVVAIAGGGSHSLALSGLATSYSPASIALLNGDNIFQGSVTAATFSGDGGALTGLSPANLNAGTAGINISGNAATATTATSATTATTANTANNFSGSLAGDVTGTQGATVVSANIPRLNGTNVFTGTNQFAGVLNATNVTNVLVGTHSGDGSGLTGLNPTNLSAGTAGISITGNAVTATTATTANNFSGSLAGDVTGTQGATVVSANIPRLNGTNGFTGTNQFAGVVVATNVNNQIAGAFTGNGSGLTSLSGSQLVGTIPLPLLPSSVVTNGAGGVNISGVFAGAGTGLTNLDVSRLITIQYGITNLFAWGRSDSGQTAVPAGLGPVIALAAGEKHSVAVRSDGTVAAWGADNASQIDVPAGLSNVVAVAAGQAHTLALRSDGTVVAWGYWGEGQIYVPAGLTNAVAVAAGGEASMALRSDGTIVAWGEAGYGQLNIPGGLNDAAAIAMGYYHSLAVRSNGTVVAWGDNTYGQLNIPGGLNGVVAVAGGNFHSLALRNNGTVVGWGNNSGGQLNIPAGLSNVVAIAAGQSHSVALRNDGAIFVWGDNSYGQRNIPGGVSKVVAIAAGLNHTLASSLFATTNIPASVALLTGNNVFQGSVTATTLSGNGSGLTSLNPANLSAGTAGINISGNASTANTAASFSGSLAGDVTGTQGATVVATVGGVTAANVAGGASLANAATSANTPNAIVTRDASGNFSASTIIANLAGNATTATTANNFSGSLAGGVTGTQGSTVVAMVGGVTAANLASGANLANAATSANTPSAVIRRDASGNFSAGTVTASLSGNATTATTANNFSGSLAGEVTGTQSATVVSSNFPRLNGTNVFTGTNQFAGVVVATNANNQIVGAFTGNGSGLTNVTAVSVAAGNITGTISLAQLPVSVVTNGASGVSISGTFTGNGGALTNLNSASISGVMSLAQLPASLVTNGTSGVNLAGTFTGTGSGITNVDLTTINSHGAFTFTTPNAGFALNSTNALASFPTDMAAADVNGDGYPDLILANSTAGTLTVMTNNRSGVFVLSATLSGFPGCSTVTAVDVNGDGYVDLISQANGNALKVVTNNGTGVFTTSATYGVNNQNNFSLFSTAADVNGDGYVDLISGNSSSGTFTVLTNINGSGVFATAYNISVGFAPTGLTAADVNGDGKPDLIFMNNGLNTLKVFTNNSSLSAVSFVLASSPTVGAGPRMVAVADINGDGKMHLVSANSGTNTLTVLTNAGAGTFATYASLTVGTGPRAVRVLDVNGDGRLDLVSADSLTNTLTVLTNNGSGFGLFSSLVVGSQPQTVVAVDVNRDSSTDLVSANAASLSVLFGSAPILSVNGNGAGLTSLNPTNLSPGTAGISISGNAATATTAGNFSGSLAGDVSGTQGATVISANFPRLNGTNVFTGTNQFAGVVLATNVNNQIAGSFTGNGAGLTNIGSGSLADGSIANVDISATAAIAYAKLNLAGSIVDGDISAAAAIADSKLATISTAGKVADSALSANVASLNRNVQAFTGGTNSFSGNIGIGSANPSYPLDVSRSTASQGDTATLRVATVSGDNLGPNIRLQHNGGSGRRYGIWSTGTNNVGGAGLLQFYDESAGGGSRMVINSNGNVGIGTTGPACPLDVSGTAGIASSGDLWVKYNVQNNWATEGANTAAISIRASGNIEAQGFISTSDARIKNVLGRSDNASDLQTLLGIEITDYRFKDAVAKGNTPQKKVIAQQVEKVFPQAVSRGTDVVPDIFQKAALKDGWVMLATDLKKGDRVKLISPTGQGVQEVLEVAEGKFRTDFKSAGNEILVYGREVNDFRTVDYEAISMLNVSATQELARKAKAQEEKLTAQEEELTELRVEVAKLRSERTSLAQSVSDLEAGFARMQKAMSKRAGITEARFTPEDVEGVSK